MIKLTYSWRAVTLLYLSTINFQIQTQILCALRSLKYQVASGSCWTHWYTRCSSKQYYRYTSTFSLSVN